MPQYLYKSGERISEIQMFRKDSIAIKFAQQVATVSKRPIELYLWEPVEGDLTKIAAFDYAGDRIQL